MQKVNIFCIRNDPLHTFHTCTKNCANWMRASCWFLCLEKSAITFGEGCSVHIFYKLLSMKSVTAFFLISSVTSKPDTRATFYGQNLDNMHLGLGHGWIITITPTLKYAVWLLIHTITMTKLGHWWVITSHGISYGVSSYQCLNCRSMALCKAAVSPLLMHWSYIAGLH